MEDILKGIILYVLILVTFRVYFFDSMCIIKTILFCYDSMYYIKTRLLSSDNIVFVDVFVNNNLRNKGAKPQCGLGVFILGRYQSFSASSSANSLRWLKSTSLDKKGGETMFRFIIGGTVIDKYDKPHKVAKKPFTGKTKESATKQFRYYVSKEYGYGVLIRDIVVEALNNAE